MDTKTNVGELFLDSSATEEITTASATYTVFPSDAIEMTKTVDRPGEIYYTGQPITFTITITNNGTETLTGLRFTDTIDPSVVPSSGTDYTVTTSSGTVTSATSNVIVDGIEVLPSGSVTITISGVIA